MSDSKERKVISEEVKAKEAREDKEAKEILGQLQTLHINVLHWDGLYSELDLSPVPGSASAVTQPAHKRLLLAKVWDEAHARKVEGENPPVYELHEAEDENPEVDKRAVLLARLAADRRSQFHSTLDSIFGNKASILSQLISGVAYLSTVCSEEDINIFTKQLVGLKENCDIDIAGGYDEALLENAKKYLELATNLSGEMQARLEVIPKAHPA